MKNLIIILGTITILILGFRLNLNTEYKTFNTKDITEVKLYYATINDTLTLNSDKLSDFWFCKDRNFKHFDFKVKISTNLYGMTHATYLHY